MHDDPTMHSVNICPRHHMESGGVFIDWLNESVSFIVLQFFTNKPKKGKAKFEKVCYIKKSVI